MKKIKNLPTEEIVNRWKKGVSQSKLADEYGVSESTIYKRIEKYYEDTGELKPETKRKKLPTEEIVSRWEKGASQSKLADEYGVSVYTIYKRIKEYYEETGKLKPETKKREFATGRKIKELPTEEIVNRWKEGVSQRKLAEKYGVSDNTIYNRIKKYYEDTGEVKPKRKEKELPTEKIVSRWEKGVSQRKLADEYGVSLKTIQNRIKGYYEETGKLKPEIKRKELPRKEIASKWEKGVSYKELTNEYGVSTNTIYKRINEYYKDIGKPKPETKRKELPTEELINRWKKGVSQRKLAEDYGVTVDTIYKIIEEYRNKMDIRRILKKPDIIIDYLRKGLSIEQIQETALDSKVIIPQEVMEKAIQIFRQKRKSGEEKERE